MGKENVVTGKMEEVESLKSNKISINNATSPIRKPKVSQFSAQYKEHRWMILFNQLHFFLFLRPRMHIS